MDDKKATPEEAEDAVMQQSYPSPIVDSAEAQYYEQLTQHRELDPQMDHQPAPPEHHGLPSMPEHQEQHEHHELHQLQNLQESPAPQQQQNSRPPVSADELQLAAQLSQGLAPMMAAAVQEQAQEQQPMQQQDGQDGQVQPQTEPNLEEQLEASLQNHEREMQSHEHELQNHNHELQNHSHELQNHSHEIQNHSHELQSHELQDVLPHPSQPQQHHYAQNPPPPPQLPHHMSMDHLSQVHPQYQIPDATPPRKRSKVSRACDECRRKKIKCDAQSEANEALCSNCRRSNAQCLFSRVPQKRGPSKGYIKELADRINTIEGRLSTNVEGGERRPSSESFVSPGLGDDIRKRPFSSISGEGFQTPSPNRISATFNSEHRSILPYLQPEFHPQMPGNSTDLALKPAAPLPYPAPTNDLGLQGQPDMMETMSQSDLPQEPSHQADQLPEIEDAVFNRYLELIHPIFPVLASSKARVQSLLWQAPLVLQNAFYKGFFSMMKHFLPDASSQMDSDPATTWRLLNEWEAEGEPRSSVTNIVRLQTQVMVLISVDCFSIASGKGLVAGPTKAEILGRAVGLGYSMRVHSRTVDPNPNPELDPDSDDNVALRAWWVLIMLDRWHALGMARPALIARELVVPRPGLEHIVGEAVYALIRASYVLTLIMPAITNPPSEPSEPQTLALAAGITQTLGWAIPANDKHPALYLTYWLLRLVSELLSPDEMQRPVNILQATRSLTGLLAAKHDLLSPITHHFAAVAALGLVELRRFRRTRGEAVRLTKEVLHYSMAPSAWNAAVRDKLSRYEARLQSAAAAAVAAGPSAAAAAAAGGQNLHQLADLATAVDGTGAATAAGPDPTPAVAAAAAVVAGDAQPGAEAALGAAGAAGANGAVPADGDGGTAGAGGAANPEAESVEDRDLPALVDVRAVLRDGYLTWFDDPRDGATVA
ncbi:uncharacterized protein B0H64DRAFT_229828 [Chaetomium fimeti]|uniref:Zn(2)-C6 fungal-type domain-containing protein n=1 Tax=Chaetomium fimeti TaxID=1854472 RepID=A0AAE0H9M7_9PEZI|nr:hypothetical protein B0H64DRAFT_229828 [Chaetomium fimeti]